jgi:hypothetical protein
MKIRLLMGRGDVEKIIQVVGVNECDGSDTAPESVVVIWGDEAEQIIERLRQIKTALETRTLRFLVSWEKLLLLKQMGLEDHSSTPLPQSSEYVATISVDPDGYGANSWIKTVIIDEPTIEYSPETAFESTITNTHMSPDLRTAGLPNSGEDKIAAQITRSQIEERTPLSEVNKAQLNAKNDITSRSFYVYKWNVGKIIGYNGDRINFVRQHTSTNVKVKTRSSGPKANVKVTGNPKQVDAAIELMSHYLSAD